MPDTDTLRSPTFYNRYDERFSTNDLRNRGVLTPEDSVRAVFEVYVRNEDAGGPEDMYRQIGSRFADAVPRLSNCDYALHRAASISISEETDFVQENEPVVVVTVFDKETGEMSQRVMAVPSPEDYSLNWSYYPVG